VSGRDRARDLAVKVAEPVLAIDLMVAHGVPLPAVSFGPVGPAEVGEEWMVGVVNDCDLALGEWDVLHGSVTSLLLLMAAVTGGLSVGPGSRKGVRGRWALNGANKLSVQGGSVERKFSRNAEVG
jgi:hypothetical protein